MTNKREIKLVERFGVLIKFKWRNPFTRGNIADILFEKGFESPPELRFPLIPPPSETSLIAKKDNAIINYVPEERIIMAIGTNIKSVVSAFEILTSSIEEDIGLKLSETSDYIETTLTARILTKKNPKEAISNFIELNRLKQFKKVLGMDSTIFSLRLVPLENNPTDYEWYDITVEPLIISPKQYRVNVVYRKPDLEKTMEFTKNIDNIILKTIEIIEEEKS